MYRGYVYVEAKYNSNSGGVVMIEAEVEPLS